MDRRNQHTHNTGLKVSGFFADRRDQFPDDSHAAAFIGKVDDRNAAIADQFAQQGRAWGRLQAANAARASARTTLRGDVVSVRRTVRGIALEDAGVAPRFKRQPGDSDQALLATARGFREEAEAVATDLAKHGLTADFLAGFSAHIDAFAASIAEKNAAQAAHMTVRASTAENVRALRTSLQHLDVIVRNQFRGDKKTLDVWKSVRHIETGPVPAASKEPEAPPATATPSAATKTA